MSLKKSENKVNSISSTRGVIWLGLLGALLTIINNAVAIFGFGLILFPIVAFTTPFIFCIGKLRYPKGLSSLIIYFPLIIASIFTLNLGPPGAYKVFFLIGPFIYDFVCIISRTGREKSRKVRVAKLYFATIGYVLGLILGAYITVALITIELPLLSRSIIGVIGFAVIFSIIGIIATKIGHSLYYKWLIKELK